MHYTLEEFNNFLKSINLDEYRDRFAHIKTVEMDLPRNIQALDIIYETYWDTQTTNTTPPKLFDEFYDEL